MEDPLHLLPSSRWEHVQRLSKSVPTWSEIETHRRWVEKGVTDLFKVYCPYGIVDRGVVAIDGNKTRTEIHIACFKEDTTDLEKALNETKIIDWVKPIIIVAVSPNIYGILDRIAKRFKSHVTVVYFDQFTLEASVPKFNVSLPAEHTFKNLTLETADLVDEKWNHRYPGSINLTKKLITENHGYGLYKNNNLISWAFIGERGSIHHLYTLDEYRGKGYATIVIKLISNVMRDEERFVCAMVGTDNLRSAKFFKNVGFLKTAKLGYYFMNYSRS